MDDDVNFSFQSFGHFDEQIKKPPVPYNFNAMAVAKGPSQSSMHRQYKLDLQKDFKQFT